MKRETEPRPWTWVETDTSEVFVLDVLIEHNRWRVVAADRMDDPAVDPVDVVGRSCGFDLIVPDAGLPAMRDGDLVAFLDTGAYQDASATNFNAMPRPPTVLVDGDRVELVEARGDDRGRVRTRHRPRATGRVRMRVNGIHHVGLTVGDLDRARWFFEEVLDLPLRDAGDDASPAIDRIVGMTDVRLRYAEYDLGAGQVLEVLAYVAPEGTPLTQEVNDPGSAHLALEVDDIQEAYARLVEHGVAVRSAPVHDRGPRDGGRAAVACYATGPDGFTVELIQRPS